MRKRKEENTISITGRKRKVHIQYVDDASRKCIWNAIVLCHHANLVCLQKEYICYRKEKPCFIVTLCRIFGLKIWQRSLSIKYTNNSFDTFAFSFLQIFLFHLWWCKWIISLHHKLQCNYMYCVHKLSADQSYLWVLSGFYTNFPVSQTCKVKIISYWLLRGGIK